MLKVAFGTAQLFGLADQASSTALLEAAVAAEFDRFDTAPSYGFGVAEVTLGHDCERGAIRGIPITTKVGLDPRDPPSRQRRVVSGVISALPGPVRAALASARVKRNIQSPETPTGRFGVSAVAFSIERSLRRLGQIDRLLLHEVSPADVTPALLKLLEGYRTRGDVRELGVATRNSFTREAMDRGCGLLGVANVEARPFGVSPPLPAGVTRVGHGLLGPSGQHLRLLHSVVDQDPMAGERWRAVVSGTSWDGVMGLATALLDRANNLPLDEVVVATTRLEAIPALAALSTRPPVDTQRREALETLISSCRSVGRSRKP